MPPRLFSASRQGQTTPRDDREWARLHLVESTCRCQPGRRFSLALFMVVLEAACGGALPSSPTTAPTMPIKPGWQAVQVLAAATAPDFPLALAGDGRGNAVATWRANSLVQSASFAMHSGWGPVETLGNSDRYGPPDVALSASGDALVAWTPLGVDAVRVRRRPSGSSIWEGVDLSTGIYIEQAPQVAIDDEGGAIVTWAQSGTGVWVARFLPGTGWERHRVLEPLAYAAYHDAVVSAHGLATVPYVFFRETGAGVLPPRWQTCGIHFRTSGGLATEVDCVEPPWRAFCCEIRAAGGTDGRTLVIWAEPQANGGWPVRAAGWWEPGRGWSVRTLLGSGSDATLAVYGRGAAFVLRSSDEVEHGHLWAHRFEVERGWLPAEDLMTPGAGSRFGTASVAAEATGRAWAAWDENLEGSNRIVAQRYLPGAGWAPSFALAVETGGLLFGPRVVVDGQGGVLVLWIEAPAGGGTVSIMARQYLTDASGH